MVDKLNKIAATGFLSDVQMKRLLELKEMQRIEKAQNKNWF